MKEYYKIGEISSLYNIGADSLRYYEQLGILKPQRDSNGYRMYSINDHTHSEHSQRTQIYRFFHEPDQRTSEGL